ncbi:class I SAM-dependent methyltransferase [Halothiobacillus sp. DCM-1]|uniref:class I SAM-dependent methyltransferase n=1 Tax=Halothiobacillus sp. DCM-1 TaxID=3112558 RepID=UPI00324C8174
MMTAQEIHALRQDLVQQVTLMAQPLTLHATWGLFSPREIDDGTRLLLDLLPPPAAGHRCIDLGCGYGPIGLALAKAQPAAEVILLDKDFVACDYARANAARNRLNNVTVSLSNGLEAVRDQKAHLIVSNVPAKVGKELWSIMLFDAWRMLEPGGELWFVSINGLRDYFKRTFKEQFGHYDKVKQGRDYTVHRAVRGAD